MTSGELLTLTVDRDALAHNVQELVRRAAPAQVMAVVKADGYNHGAAEAARVFLANGATQLGVATIAEALALREQGITAPILAWIWDPTAAEAVSEAITHNVDLGVPSVSHLHTVVASYHALLSGGAGDRMLNPPPRITVMVDSGLSRSGFSPATWPEAVRALADAHTAGDVEITGAFTHLACADEPDHPQNNKQKGRFEQAVAQLRAAGIDCPVNHMCNSPAALTRPDMYYQMIRPGVALYGMDPLGADEQDQNAQHQNAQYQQKYNLIPAMTVSAPVTATRVVKAGESVSYGATWTATEDTATAIVPMGYADGLPRALSGKLQVMINGRRYQQIGRVCMDQVVVALGPVGAPEAEAVHPGDEAVLFGQPGPCVGVDGQPAAAPTATEWAQLLDTIHYEVLTSPHTRVRRRYRGRGIAPAGTVRVSTADATRSFAQALGSLLHAGDLVILDGPLGAGKTTFTQGLARGLQVSGRVASPTFTIARVHPGPVPLIHVDAYRLLGEDGLGDGLTDPLAALDSLDLDTDLPRSVVVAEWGAAVADALKQDYLLIRFHRAQGAETTDAGATDAGVTGAGTGDAGAKEAGTSEGPEETAGAPGAEWEDSFSLNEDEIAEEFSTDEPRIISWEWVRR